MAAPAGPVFLSHQRASKPLVDATAALLMARGIPVWLDTQQILPGDSLMRRIGEGVEACSVLLVFLSPEYLSSENCNRELQLAAGYRKPIVVLRLAGVECPPRGSAGTFAADMAPVLAGTTYLALGAGATCAPERELLAALAARGVAPPAAAGGGAAAHPAAAAPALAAIPERELTLGRRIGAGGFGIVHEGLWQGTPVAVKSLQREAGEVGEAPARAFAREVEVLARLRHPNVVPVFGVVAHADGRISLVEELEVGGTLHERVHGGGGGGSGGGARMGVAEIARVGAEIARALAYAHAQGVTHNDVKGANVLFNAGGAAVLADFGLAKRVQNALPDTAAALLRASSSSGGGAGGGLLGTVNYTAPENFNDESAGYGQPPGDVYSLGLLLFEMASGKEPWAGRGMIAIADAVRAGLRPALGGGVDARLRGLVERCWAQDARARPGAAAVAAELAALAAAGGAAAERPTAGIGAARVVALMRAGAADARAAEAGVRALNEIASTDGGVADIVASGAAPAIVAALTAHAGVAAVALYGCAALVDVAGRSVAGKAACVASGAAPVVVAALRAHERVADVAQYGCWALANIAYSDSGKAACLSAGAVPAAVAALTLHVHAAAVVKYSFWALSSLGASAPGAHACVAAGAVPAVAAALRAHAGAADLAHYGCWALMNIAANSVPGKGACVASGAVRAIVAALIAHSRVTDVAHYGSWALRNIGYTDPSHRAAIVTAGAVPILAAIVSWHSGDARDMARDVLDKLGYTDAGALKN